MKEIKAYVRTDTIQQVIWALEEKGFTAITVIDVSVLGHLADERQTKLSIEFSYKYSKLVKIELVCTDKDVDQVVDIIQKKGCTHFPGDGIVFVSPVLRAIEIRTREEGDTILHA